MHEWDSGQKYRQGSGRYANSGGKNRKKYDLWKDEKRKAFFHPKNKNGYWAFIARGLSDAEARAKEPLIAA